MLLEVINNVETTNFYRAGDKFAHIMTFVVIALFALMFLYAAVKYAKR
jgi:magnesium-transporting ATPase (P-type)